MKRFGLVLCLLLPMVCQADVYKCSFPDGHNIYTNDAPKPGDTNAPYCTKMTRETYPPTAEEIRAFRKTLAVGDVSSVGMVIELKRPIALVQNRDGSTKWYRIDVLTPPWSIK
ncbi:DUF4124 domain-containing protein [Uliginosibacterium sp. TH139]|uniref:DUF4124 domain-containing protein n=1 Tax=Uliginosibacterium sp. TH139 TaxID=2067453 RepID=UPI000C79FD74|nr:hypothetical protein C0V76_13890 [Uliginosibacterium sp. TH139]